MLHPRLSVELFDPLARRAAETLHAAGFQAVFAGGCVRDALLGRPAQDTDIATNAKPDDVLRLFPRARHIGKAFGVTLVPVEGHYFEVATFREDIGSADGRHPESVNFAEAAQDAHRRDFTINGLFYDPARADVLDYVEGCSDLERRIIRAIGDPVARFEEDHLRMLRAIRFAVTLDFTIEPGTFAAIRSLAPKIQRISAERIREELTRILTEAKRPGDGLRLLRQTMLLKEILPEADAMVGVQQPPEYHPEGDVFVHTALALDQLIHPNPTLAWSVLLHDIGKPPTFREEDGRIRFDQHAAVGADMADTILRRLRASNELREAVVLAVRQHMRFTDWPHMKPSTRKRILAHPLFPIELQLHRADCLASNGSLETYFAAQAEYERITNEPQLPAPWVNGTDVMQLGIPEGPEVKHWRHQAYEAQLEGRFADRDALLAWIKEEITRVSQNQHRGRASSSPTPPNPSPESD